MSRMAVLMFAAAAGCTSSAADAADTGADAEDRPFKLLVPSRHVRPT
jgi:hypothetical protein